MADQPQDKEFLEFIVKNIVDHPEEVEIERKVDEMGVLLTLHVHSEDMGQVIGRGGSTARALRTLLRIVGMKKRARVNLKIAEPEERAGGAEQESSEQEESQEDLEDLEL